MNLDLLQRALSRAGISAPASKEELAARQDEYVEMALSALCDGQDRSVGAYNALRERVLGLAGELEEAADAATPMFGADNPCAVAARRIREAVGENRP